MKLRKTKTQIAKEIGISRQSVSEWFSGKSKPSYENMIKLSHVLDVSLNHIAELINESVMHRKNRQEVKQE